MTHIDLNSRLKRGMAQKMFLLNAYKKKTDWTFIVKGTTNDYELHINPELFNCNCPDYSQRGRICKHLYFVIGRIAQHTELLTKLETEIETGSRESKLTPDELTLLSNKLVERLTQRLLDYGKETESIPIPNNVIDDDCPICYEPLNTGTLTQCGEGTGQSICKNYFHNECITEWLSAHHSCPMCRSVWNNTVDDKFDPFDKLDKIELLFS